MHPLLVKSLRVTDIVLEQDVMLHFPYHSFMHVTDMLREAAIDPDVTAIKITCYRLAPIKSGQYPDQCCKNRKACTALVNCVHVSKKKQT